MLDVGTISLLLLLGMFALLMLGVPLGFASGTLAIAVLYMKFGDSIFSSFGRGPLNVLGQRVYGLVTDYVLISIPLFILMANLFERTGIAEEMYASLNRWLSRTRGGIAIVTCIMAVIMAAMSGIIGGEVVLLGLIALPQMLRLGYDQRLAVGTICAGGSLGTMIPPSIVLIIYGLVTETSVKALFTASFLPGFMLAGFYIVYIFSLTRLRPETAPLAEPQEGEPRGMEKFLLFATFLLTVLTGFAVALMLRAGFLFATGQNQIAEVQAPVTLGMTWHIPWFIGIIAGALALIFGALGRERLRDSWAMGKGLVAPLTVVGVVLGSIYGGITGITEAAAMGVVAVLIIGLLRRSLNVGMVMESLSRTISATGTIMWVTLGATALAGAYTIAGGPAFIAQSIVGTDIPTMSVILLMMLVFLVLGALMDWVGIVLLVMPVFLPVVQKLPVAELGFIGGIDAAHVSVWFGVLFAMNMQVSFLSPPFGPAAFFLKSVAPPEITLAQIFRGFAPFIMLQLLALAALLAWPGIVTALL
ncbi:MAG: TRAP transporter large permease subunit [Pikeienuella sp.]